MTNFTFYFKRISLFMADLLFPEKCIVCGCVVSILNNRVCPECMGKINDLRDHCQRCYGLVEQGNCTICSDRAFYLDGNYTLTEYTGVMETILHGLKFSMARRAAFPLAEMLNRKFACVIRKCDVITFVPMNKAKKWRRGYNQSEIIARNIGKRTGIPCKTLLKERPKSGTQRTLRLRDRFLNALDRYSVTDKPMVKGKVLLLVDDVFTTGATINECARILKEKGAVAVYSVTLARVGIKKLENAG